MRDIGAELLEHADDLMDMLAMRHADIDQSEHQDRGGEKFQQGATLAQRSLTMRAAI